ncbi:MAG: DUF1592 domain-containing protein [Opitutaceae bacterium]|nr:DUF1592 domain-containing protein [Opitutaceae bacterium]
MLAIFVGSILCCHAKELLLSPSQRVFLEDNCFDCHDSETHKGGLDLETLPFDLKEEMSLAKWIEVYDRVREGEMPPKKRPRPAPTDVYDFLGHLAEPLVAADRAWQMADGRAMLRRLNRQEFENALRDLLQAPWLQIKDILPEDRVMYGFNKVGAALDVSYIEMGRYLSAVDYALRQVVARQASRPEAKVVRYYAREQKEFTQNMNSLRLSYRSTFPVLGARGQPDVRLGKVPITVGAADPETREQEGMGVVASSYQPLEPAFDSFTAPVAGRYRIRVCAHSIWVGPGPSKMWWLPNLDDISPGRRSEPVVIYAVLLPNLMRRIGQFDFTSEPAVKEIETWLLEGETIRPDAVRFFRSRGSNDRNPLAKEEGMPGVSFRWVEVEGPLYDAWPTTGHRLLFGDLPLEKPEPGSAEQVELISRHPDADAERLLRGFLQHACRRPVGEVELQRFLPLVDHALKGGASFVNAMIACYSAVLCSPEFIYLHETPGEIDDHALASRLSFFLENSAPDDELRGLATQGVLGHSDTLRAQTNRLLDGPTSRRFSDAFLDYWLDLRKIAATSPDSTLYPDYYLDDFLTESALEETRLYFAELIRKDLPARYIVSSDFAFVNERLAVHYGLPPMEGVALRRVALPPDSFRGGLLTQASVLKVTANGTTTSPVVRGAWIMGRILGQPPRPPPPGTPAVEPDIRGAVTIRQQLDSHRAQESCAVCHTKIDPAGFALENFDIMGGWRDRYRAVAPGVPTMAGFGHNGHKYLFHLALPVDTSGQLPDGRRFNDIREFKRLLLSDEKAIARNLVRQLVVFATGEPVRFSDRIKIEEILERSGAQQFGVRTLIHETIQSDMFRNK